MFSFESDRTPRPDDPAAEFKSLVARVDAEYSDQLDQLFSAEWTQAATGYSSFQEFVDAGFEDHEAITEIPEDELDDWVAEQSSFDDWDEMMEAAANQWIEREF